MSDPAAPPPWTASAVQLPPVAPPFAAPAVSERAPQLRAAGVLVAVLAVLGALLGVLWQAWSPPGPFGLRLPAGVQADETEAFVAGDGRFALIVAVVGLLAGLAAWFVPVLRRNRGPWVAVGLAVGGLLGAVLTELVGWALRGDGSTYSCGDGGSLTCIRHLPLTVHMHALLLIEAVVALLVYILFVAFAVADDLGRPDTPAARHTPQPAAESAAQSAQPVLTPPAPSVPGGPFVNGGPSVGPQGDLQDPWRHGDGAGAPQ